MTKRSYSLHLIWTRVSAWARARAPQAGHLALKLDCALVKKTRKESPRAYMHTHHLPRRVCASSDAGALSIEHVVGLFLHEIGHGLAQKVYGRSEQEDADRAVKEILGVRIHYKGPLLLEWVQPMVARRILSHY